MNEFKVGGYVVSAAGHDSGKYYVIFQIDSEYVYLVDGKIRPLNNPKKKKIKHVEMLEQSNQTLSDKISNKTVKNEEIKRAIKLLQHSNASKGGQSLQKDKET
ncbi:MAG: KOW domain-containing RNA-binding protein [Herbinix sp.]|nr:KOW domain-containing RNA-binding protein [Herbinix sp.]